MSLGEMQQLFGLVQEIDQMLGSIEQKTQALEKATPEVTQTGLTTQQTTRAIYRFNSILAHMGLPPNVNDAIRKFQQLIFMTRMLQMSLTFLSLSTPYGYIMGGLGAVSIAMSSSDWMMTIGE